MHSIDVQCDVCGNWTDRACMERNLTQARKMLKRQGWHVSRSWDICPDCWAVGHRRPKPEVTE